MRRFLTYWWIGCAFVNGFLFGLFDSKTALVLGVLSYAMFWRSMFKLKDNECENSVWVEHEHSVPEHLVKENQKNG